jgi:hypothetical protein
LQSSPITLSHLPLPQLPTPQPPHWFLHSPTQMSSQAVWQQKESIWQTQLSQEQPGQPGLAFA